eukprot:m.25596 g.25596  ORF g.25596 m.25596 type:complete len:411 (-) comp15077_c0_seq1:130-1362(-)
MAMSLSSSIFVVAVAVAIGNNEVGATNTLLAGDPKVDWSGRRTINSDSSVSFDWLGVSARVGVTDATWVSAIVVSAQTSFRRGTRIKVYISDQDFPLYPQTQFWVGPNASVEGNLMSNSTMLFMGNSKSSPLVVTLENIVDPQYGTSITTVVSFESDGTFVDPGPRVSLPTGAKVTIPRNIEIIGDSITAATNVVRPEFAPQCGDGGFQSDWSQSYSGLLCHRFGAHCSTVAVGGKCVMRECGGLQMPDYFTGAFYEDGGNPTYGFKTNSFKPDAMVIDLGTNDMRAITSLGYNVTTGKGPGMDRFTQETVAFMKNATMLYGKPDIQFFLTVGPMENTTITGTEAAVSAAIAEGLNVTMIDMRTACAAARIHGSGDSDWCDGCASHPGVEGHRGMYEAAWPVISKVMGWE